MTPLRTGERASADTISRMSSAESGRTASAPVQAVRRTMSALQLLAAHPEGVSVLELADALQAEKSIASRVLSTLSADDWVVRDPGSDRYRLSLRLVALTTRYTDHLGFPDLCQPILQELSQHTGELAQLAAVDGDHLVLSAYAEPRGRGLRVSPRLGEDVSPHATASGQAWLSTLPVDRAVNVALRLGLRPLTDRTVTDVTSLVAALSTASARGYAFVEGEFLEQVNALAVPVGAERFDTAVGTLAISAPAHRLRAPQIPDTLKRLQAAARELTAVWPSSMAHLARTRPTV